MKLSSIGISIGSFALLLAIFSFWAGPFSPAPTLTMESSVAEKITSFTSYIYKMTRNKCLDILKKKGNQVKIMKEWSFDEKYFPDFMESDHLNRLNKERVNQAIQQLKPEQAACIRLFYLHHMSYQEIVAETDFDTNQVKSHLQNGKRKLTQLISKF